MYRVPLALAALAVMATPALSKPCANHPVKATHDHPDRAACMKQYRRDQQPWPPRPTKAEIIQRIGRDQWNKAMRVAYCETGANPNHYPNGAYIGMMGMARSTYGIGQAVTKYRWPAEGASVPEQIAIGYVVAQRFGWSAWGCGGA